MAQRDFEEENEQLSEASDVSSLFGVEQTDVMTGGTNKRRYLYYQIKMSILNAMQIDIVVSFMMESGVREVPVAALPPLRKLLPHNSLKNLIIQQIVWYLVLNNASVVLNNTSANVLLNSYIIDTPPT